MAAQAAKVIRMGTAQRELTGELRCVARQPILDLQGRVHGYDLIFRNTPDSVFRRDAGLAVETMLDNQVIFGLDRGLGAGALAGIDGPGSAGKP